MIKLIVATDKNNLIGNVDKMPWRIKEEFEHFRNTTISHSLLFGRTTFLGLPGKLDKRTIYVLSEQTLDNCITIHNETELKNLFAKFKTNNEVLFIAGGKSIYEKYFEYADELLISRVDGDYQGNVYLNLNLSNYEVIKKQKFEKFVVETYKRIQKTH
ncbi:dihydrofolate reductase [Mycoplasma crocodyli]|uniref:dihydrofolate reductase n=1 Tax=Mycoplasma crocodyli (strain ATCC 51981 / MP145) TaxID=512564 RepID=D5E6F5_MYCCM|nr:dihydrofolate reductase [Mycoplasma crocodyli]ADE19446.1 dihydrofolate reductase [Mycoplasma crocodyli MP145]